MRVKRIDILASKGINPGFEVDGFDAHLTIIEGRNESGKSTLAGAIRALLWPDRHQSLRARGEFELDGKTFHSFVDVHGGSWQGDAPALPDASAGRGIIVGIGDLWTDDAHDLAIRMAMTRELHGGFDLHAMHEAAEATTPTAPRRDAEGAERALNAARSEATALMAQEARLPELRARARACRERAAQGPLARNALERLDTLEGLSELRARLERMPAGARRVVGDEDQRLGEIDRRLDEEAVAIEHERAAAASAREQIDQLEVPSDGVDAGDLEVLAGLDSELLGLERQRGDSERRAAELQAAGDAEPTSMRALDEAALDELEAALNLAHETRERRARDLAAAEAPDDTRPRQPSRTFAVVTIAFVALAGVAAGFEEAWISVALAAAGLAGGIVVLIRSQSTTPGRSADLSDQAARSNAAYQAAVDRVREIAGNDKALVSTLAIATAADRAKRLDALRVELHGALAGVESLSAQRDDLLRRASGVFARYSMPACTGTDELSRGRTNLEERRREYERLTRAESEADRLQAQAEHRLAHARRQRDELLERIELSQDRLEELAEWLRLRGEANELADEIRRQEAVLERLDASLDNAPELLEFDRTALQDRLRACAAATAEADSLQRDIGEIEGQVRAARRRADVTNALARLERAAKRVAEARDEACAKAARRLILDHAVASVQGDDVPAIVQLADRWLARFTANAYGLRIERGEPVVYDLRSGVEKGYDALSTGTRAQALLAMRLAGAMDAERRVGAAPLPLVLDEPLATTDDARFEAVCVSIFELAREGRQLVYLTCDPGHAANLERLSGQHQLSCTRVNLDEKRRRQAAARVPAAALLEPKPGPSPDEMPREAYLEAIGVRPVDPWRGTEGIDLYYVLRDDLTTLHALREREISSIGQVLARPGLVDRPELIEACRCVDRLVRAWRRGRARPLNHRDILDSGAVSATYLERVIELAQEVNCSAGALLDALDRGHVKGFRSNKTDQLRAHFAEQGLLPEASVLSRAELLAEALQGEVIGTSRQDGSPLLSIAKGMLEVLEAAGGTGGEALAEQRA